MVSRVTPDAFDIWDDIDSLGPRLNTYVERSKTLKPEAIRLEEALIRGRSDRADSGFEEEGVNRSGVTRAGELH